MTHDPTQTQIDKLDARVSSLEKRVDSQGVSIENVRNDTIAIRAEFQAVAKATAEASARVEAQVQALIVQLAEHTGAQKKQIELDEAKLARLKKIAVVIGIVCTVLGAALSDQEIASTIWVRYLHLNEPWDITNTTGK